MILEEQRLDLEQQKIVQAIKRLEESLLYTETYERLVENKDFQDHLARLRRMVEWHDDQLAASLILLTQLFGEKRKELDLLLTSFQVRKMLLEELIAEPEQVIKTAKEARNRIDELNEKLKDYGEPNGN